MTQEEMSSSLANSLTKNLQLEKNIKEN